MQLPRNYFANLSTVKYKEYLKLLPKVKNDNARAITMLILTFFAMGFLGIFAINPTLTTIVELQKQLDESRYVYDQLTTKIKNLTTLGDQYKVITDDLPYVFDAIPKTPDVPSLVGQLHALSAKDNVEIDALRIESVQLSKILKPDIDSLTFTFTIEAQGDYDQIMNFSSDLITFNRILTIDNISIGKNNRTGLLLLSVKGRGYFKQ